MSSEKKTKNSNDELALFEMPFMTQKENGSFDHFLRTDVREADDKYIMEVDVPGFSKDDISISLDGGYLTITAQSHSVEEKIQSAYVRHERFFASCQRSFYVGSIKESDISASLHNGVLMIVLPKLFKKNHNTKNIDIK